MDRSKGSKKLHIDPAENRRPVTSSQVYLQGASSTANVNSRLAEFFMPSSDRQPLNYSIQTGEEFALEFIRDKGISRKHHVTNNSETQIAATSIVDQRRMYGIPIAGTPSDVRVLPTLRVQYEEKKNNIPIESEYHNLLGEYVSNTSSDYGVGFLPLGASKYTKKMKFLCSYGGSILHRPGDGKLRYVGGNTHIMAISKDMPWLELKQRTIAMYQKPHVIKYQLPGEDLDSLVSVSCDDDMEQMFEECSDLEDNEGSNKHRIFLFSDDNVDAHYSLGSMEGDYEARYFNAINGMDGSTKVSFGRDLTSTSRTESDQFLIFNVELDGAMASTVASAKVQSRVTPQAASSIPPLKSLPSRMPAELFGDFNIQPTYHDHKRHSAGDSHRVIYSNESHNSEVKGNPNPIPSMSSDLSAPANQIYVPSGHKLPARHRGLALSYSRGILSKDQMVEPREFKSGTGDQRKERTEVKELQSIYNHSLAAKRDLPLGDLYSKESYGNSAPERTKSWLKNYEKPKGSQLEDVPKPVKNHLPSEGGFLPTSSDVFTSRIPANVANTRLRAPVPYSTSSEVFHIPMVPWEPHGVQVQLPKPDNLVVFQPQLLNQDSEVKQGLSAKSSNPLAKGNKFSDFHNSSISEKSTSPTVVTISNPGEIERHKDLADTGGQMNLFGAESASEMPITSRFAHQLLSGRDLIDCNEYDAQPGVTSDFEHKKPVNKSAYGVQTKFEDHDQKFIQEYQLSDVKSHTEERKSQEPDCRKCLESPASMGDIFMMEIELKNEIKMQEGSIGLNHSSNQETIMTEKNSPSLSNKTSRQEDIVSDGNKFNNIEYPTYAYLERNTGPSIEEKTLTVKARTIEEPPFSNTPGKDDLVANFSMKIHMSEPSVRVLDQTGLQSNNSRNMYKDQTIRPSLHFDVEKQDSDPCQLGIQNPNVRAQQNLAAELDEVKEPLTNINEILQEPARQNEESALEDSEVIEGSHSDIELPYMQVIKDEELEELRELGSGTFGTVYHGRWKGTDVAIKRIKSSCFNGPSSQRDKLTSDFWREAHILAKLHHPNVVAFYGVVMNGPQGTFAAITEFMVNGSLKRALLQKKRYLDYYKRLLIARDAAIGMEYLHSKNIIHFDLKCDNLLVDLKDHSRPICKVGDFGLSRIKRATLVSGGMKGTLPWMAPELLNISSNRVSEKVDVYSFGIVMWEILTSEEPYADMHYGAVIGGILNDTLRPHVPKSCNQEWRRLMESCWTTQPNERPSFAEIASRLSTMSQSFETGKPDG